MPSKFFSQFIPCTAVVPCRATLFPSFFKKCNCYVFIILAVLPEVCGSLTHAPVYSPFPHYHPLG